ncbi:hypothetical protein LRH25_30330 [Ideonella azotifigens]|uniref:Uncharacterized protein n=2 Tax=Ideonella azotifigens TaxID=513160 RepID=A0ABN1K331_9BURK|nr:hypothetical protein [Ideonella azotifigens]MCD2344631.1 hypothetical protein [Ideonella azotifigens]
MSTPLTHGQRIGLASLIYAVLVACMMAVVWKSGLQPGQAKPRVNEMLSFERLPSPSCDEIETGKLVLKVEGMDTGLRAVGCQDGPKPVATFWFHHGDNKLPAEADQAVWTVILGQPLSAVKDGRTLGYELVQTNEDGKTAHLSPRGRQFSFAIFAWWSPVAFAIVAYVWALLIYLARFSALLRDGAVPSTPLASRTFSLAKTQMAWWFAIVFASFVFLWLVTGEMPVISGQALSLMGISSATTLASVGVSADRKADAGNSGVFFHDLLSDANGLTIHRLQMLVMTVALGLMFLIHVGTRLTMPELDPSILTLMGLSAGTYVGLKLPEAQQGSTPPPTAPPPSPPPPAVDGQPG